MTTTSAIELTLHKFLIEITGDSSLKADTDLLAAGLLDSLTMMDLVVFIEVEFQHRIAIDDLRPEKFRTIGAMAQLIDHLRQSREDSRAA